MSPRFVSTCTQPSAPTTLRLVTLFLTFFAFELSDGQTYIPTGKIRNVAIRTADNNIPGTKLGLYKVFNSSSATVIHVEN